MCGIAGVFGITDPETVNRMLSTMIHRGPDDGFLVAGPRFTLGARRLSIVGLLDGRQPLSNETGTVWAAQNGELYNYPDVYARLKSGGHTLSTHCDTEILTHLYEDHGVDLVHHIDGMFAVSIWDKESETGLLARDRVGKKPLYYSIVGDALYYASEIKALLMVEGFQRKICLPALHHFLSFKHVPCPLTIFEGIRMLPPAHRLVFQPGRAVRVDRYWQADFSDTSSLDGVPEEELVDELLRLLRSGVERRLMSDVPIGFFLSGGIDSSLTTALATEVSTEPVKTFTLTYAGDSSTDGKNQDKRWARWTALNFGTEHFEEEIEFQRFPENLRRIIACFDEPFAGTTSTYFLSALIAKHVKVAVSGDGADELFGSYLSHRLATPLSRFRDYLQTGDRSLITPFENDVEKLADLHAPEEWLWRSKLLVYSEEQKLDLYSPDVAQTLKGFSSAELLRDAFAQVRAVQPLNRVLEAEFNTIFPDQVLAFVDRLSMAHSLEVRSAFLDTRVVEFAAKLPDRYKIRNGQTKYLLKKAALRYFPEEMVLRKKEGFLLPITEWLLGDLEDYVRTTLQPERLRAHGIFRSEGVQQLIDTLYRSASSYVDVNRVFALVVFQEWYDQYLREHQVNFSRPCPQQVDVLLQ